MSDPRSSVIDRVDDAIYAVEKFIVSAFTVVMTVAVFFDVVHRIFVSPQSRFAALWQAAGVSEGTAATLGMVTLLLVALLIVYGAVRERSLSRQRKARERGEDIAARTPLASLGVAAGIVAALAIGIKLFVTLMPNGLVWSQTLGLSLMLWIGLMGASMAAKQRRHLALEIGKKIWPQAWQKYVRVVAGVLVAALCGFLGWLAWTLIVSEFHDYDPVYRTGMFTGLPLPKFVVFSILPYGFIMIVVRYLRGNIAAGDVSELDHILKTSETQS